MSVNNVVCFHWCLFTHLLAKLHKNPRNCAEPTHFLLPPLNMVYPQPNALFFQAF